MDINGLSAYVTIACRHGTVFAIEKGRCNESPSSCLVVCTVPARSGVTPNYPAQNTITTVDSTPGEFCNQWPPGDKRNCSETEVVRPFGAHQMRISGRECTMSLSTLSGSQYARLDPRNQLRSYGTTFDERFKVKTLWIKTGTGDDDLHEAFMSFLQASCDAPLVVSRLLLRQKRTVRLLLLPLPLTNTRGNRPRASPLVRCVGVTESWSRYFGPVQSWSMICMYCVALAALVKDPTDEARSSVHLFFPSLFLAPLRTIFFHRRPSSVLYSGSTLLRLLTLTKLPIAGEPRLSPCRLPFKLGAGDGDGCLRICPQLGTLLKGW